MNDKTKLVKEAKNDKASRRCWSAYQKGLGKMGLGEMELGEMLPNRVNIACRLYLQLGVTITTTIH